MKVVYLHELLPKTSIKVKEKYSPYINGRLIPNLLLLPNIIVHRDFPSFPLLPTPLLGLATNVGKFLQWNLEIIGHKEFIILSVQSKRRMIVVYSVQCQHKIDETPEARRRLSPVRVFFSQRLAITKCARCSSTWVLEAALATVANKT